MLKKEFESLAGYRVTDSDYFGIIEPMYMATDCTKAEFVQMLDRRRFALPTRSEELAKMKRQAKKYASSADCEAWFKLEDMAEEFGEVFHHIDRRSGSDWCYIREQRSHTSGAVLSVSLEIGTAGGFRDSVSLYEKKNTSAYERMVF